MYFIQSTNLHVKSHPKTEASRIIFDHLSGHYAPAKPMHKVDHHIPWFRCQLESDPLSLRRSLVALWRAAGGELSALFLNSGGLKELKTKGCARQEGTN